MAVHNIEIGNQIFEIICQEGEEDYLNAAAQILDTEAQMVVQNSDRIGEKRMLLMAGLMLADRMAGVQERLDRLEKDSNQREMALEEQNSAEAEAAALRSDIEEKDSEIADLQNAMQQLSIDLARATETDQVLRADIEGLQAKLAKMAQPEGAAVEAEPDPKIAEELEHKELQVRDLTARLSSVAADLEAEKAKPLPEPAPEVDPYVQASIEAERDEAEAEAKAAKEEVENLRAELEQVKADRDQLSKAEATARDELEAEISKKSKEIEDLEAKVNSGPETVNRLTAAEKTIERIVATAEAAAADVA